MEGAEGDPDGQTPQGTQVPNPVELALQNSYLLNQILAKLPTPSLKSSRGVSLSWYSEATRLASKRSKIILPCRAWTGARDWYGYRELDEINFYEKLKGLKSTLDNCIDPSGFFKRIRIEDYRWFPNETFHLIIKEYGSCLNEMEILFKCDVGRSTLKPEIAVKAMVGMNSGLGIGWHLPNLTSLTIDGITTKDSFSHLSQITEQFTDSLKNLSITYDVVSVGRSGQETLLTTPTMDSNLTLNTVTDKLSNLEHLFVKGTRWDNKTLNQLIDNLKTSNKLKTLHLSHCVVTEVADSYEPLYTSLVKRYPNILSLKLFVNGTKTPTDFLNFPFAKVQEALKVISQFKNLAHLELGTTSLSSSFDLPQALTILGTFSGLKSFALVHNPSGFVKIPRPNISPDDLRLALAHLTKGRLRPPHPTITLCGFIIADHHLAQKIAREKRVHLILSQPPAVPHHHHHHRPPQIEYIDLTESESDEEEEEEDSSDDGFDSDDEFNDIILDMV